ncbi:helix-turn-helix domain-containing protein [Hyphomicrobium sp. MC1]|uniref:helix-turn-helix domain-containing protein n=1 Tax=Hyphomicrobium sp. (strain MC1) TaxID=717785 RepID=UPI000213ED9D|nr:XRE family transcriptional regulator [Hyphomicrobium sp. MC1]CCB66653.1 Transcriptional regulator, XRE family [Hyphomicrobium sp. MC1]
MKSNDKFFTKKKSTSVAAEDLVEPLSLGPLIRDLRRKKGVTLQELADAVGRSVGFISQIERGISQPTVLDLSVISERLGVPGNYFYAMAAPPERSWVTHPNNRRTLRYAGGIIDHLVSPSLAGKLSVIESIFEPGADSGDQHIIEHQEQAIYVLEGELTIWVHGEPVTLKISDACQLESGAPTRYANRGKKKARVLWIYC